MNSKLHAVCDSQGWPRSLFLTAGPVCDFIGAAALLSTLPQAKALLADKGYDADWFRDAARRAWHRGMYPTEIK